MRDLVAQLLSSLVDVVAERDYFRRQDLVSIDDMMTWTYVFFDLETTMDAKKQVVEIGHVARRFVDGAWTSAGPDFQTLVRLDRDVDDVALGTHFHHISREMLMEDGVPCFEQAMETWTMTLRQVASLSTCLVLVAHNGLAFDVKCLVSQYGDGFWSLMATVGVTHFLDTMQAFRDMKRRGVVTSAGLQSVYSTFIDQPVEAHRALGDSLALCRIVELLGIRGGVTEWNHVERQQRLKRKRLVKRKGRRRLCESERLSWSEWSSLELNLVSFYSACGV